VKKKEKISSKHRRGMISLYVISPDSKNDEFVFVKGEKFIEIT